MLLKIKNNPKKTIFFSGLLGYGIHYANEKFKENKLRRQFCDNAKKLGEKSIHPMQELTKITVIHNPFANSRQSLQLFKKNIFPLLNLSGYKVKIVETERAEEAKELMSVLKAEDQDCVFVAGGDGTLLEVATGLLRRADLRNQMHKVPLVLAPLGSSNSFVNKWFKKHFENKISACNESVSLIEEKRIKPTNALIIRTLPDATSETEPNITEENTNPKEIYALSGLEWSLDRDVLTNGKRKWLFGPYRLHVQYIWSGIRRKYLSSNKSAVLLYQEHCQGCSKCVTNHSHVNSQSSKRSYLSSFARFMLPMYFKDTIAKERYDELEYNRKSKIVNPNCGLVHEKRLLDVRGLSVIMNEDLLQVSIRDKEPKCAEYVKSGIRNLGQVPYDATNVADETFQCTQLKIIPENATAQKFYIDNEELDVVPVEMGVLKDALYLYS